MKKLSSLSIFFPCLNDGNTISDLVAKAYRVGEKVSRDCEVIIIENGSLSPTLKVLDNLEKKYPNLRVIRFPKALGYGGVLGEGFARVKKEWVFYTDADGQYDPSEFPLLVDKLTPNVDVVNGFKKMRNDSWVRRVVGTIYNGFLHLFYDLPIKDIDCDFRLFRRSLVTNLSLTSKSGGIGLELVLKFKARGAHFAEVGISHFSRATGQSEFFRLHHILQTVRDYWRLYLPLENPH